MMRKILFASKVNLLSRLPVPIARKCLQRTECDQPLPADAMRDKQLLVDVSVIISNDARTGIQRVVRALLLQLLRQPPVGYHVRPVFATRKHGFHYAPDHFGLPEAQASGTEKTVAVTAGPDDLFLGLDLAAHLLPRHQTELAQWKRSGVKLHIVVYDLLPLLHPQWFNPKTTRNFHRWLRTVAIYADSIICISHTVKAEVNSWLHQHYALGAGTIPVNVIPLGADIQASAPSYGLPEDVDQLMAVLASKPTILMVGTLEPRKGHDQVLAAFDELWKQDHDINLVIVGKPGWKTEALQQSLRTYPKVRKHLYWLEDVSDELLGLLYASTDGVIAASHAEGYGLPLVEALSHGKPVLARDIPVFREVASDGLVRFFQGESPSALADNILNCLVNNTPANGNAQRPGSITWRESARSLVSALSEECECA